MTEPEPADTEDEGRRYPSTIGGMFYLLVVVVVAAALALVVLDEWRSGIRLMGGALIFGAVVRLVLRSRDAGMLEYMEMLAVFEASRRSMLPRRYRDMTQGAFNERLRELKRELRI